MKQGEVRRVCIRSVPLDYIISDDVVQSVLSFLPYQSSLKAVSKNFNDLFTRNEALSLDHTETDWTLFVDEKRTEIKRLQTKMTDDITTIRKEYENLIRGTKLGLQIIMQPILREQVTARQMGIRSGDLMAYCRTCLTKIRHRELKSCGHFSCHNMECSSCLRTCPDGHEFCCTKYCRDCQFETMPCGDSICWHCKCYRHKQCPCRWISGETGEWWCFGGHIAAYSFALNAKHQRSDMLWNQ